MFRKLNNKGFTIVETLIVLAIAATIILVVLLAVPGLQRSSRNTTARAATSNIIAGWNEQMAALSGASPGVPTGGSAGTILINSVSYKLASGITPTVFTATTGTYAMGFSASATTGTLAATGMTLSPNNVVVISSATCSTGGVTFGTSTQIAVLYPIENGGTGAVGCIQG